MTEESTVATLEEALRFEGDVSPDERDEVIERFNSLGSRLRSYPAGTVELALTVKERDSASQHTTLEAWIAGENRLVATSELSDFEQALTEVRDNLIRQMTDQKNRSEPRQNRQHRDTSS